MGPNSDLLTNLPDNVKLMILERLPLQDAVQASILSTHWKYKWAKLRRVILDEEFFTTVILERPGPSDLSSRYSDIVVKLLLRHSGPLHKLALYVPLCITDTKVCEWLQLAYRKDVSELSLIYTRLRMGRLPWIVFDYARLTQLTLQNCTIETLPIGFTGFPRLITLESLNCDWWSGQLLEVFISRCPQLRLLRLLNFDVQDLTIDGPKLEHLFVQGFLWTLRLGNMTANIRTMHLDSLTDFRFSLDCTSLPCLHSLRLGPKIWILEGINFPSSAANLNNFNILHQVQQQLSKQALMLDLHRLQTQTLELIGLPLSCPVISNSVLKLLSSSSVLQKLYIENADYGVNSRVKLLQTETYILPELERGKLPSLKQVELVCFSGLGAQQLRFIKTILKYSPVLEVMTIKFSDGVKEDKDTELTQYSRAAKDAQIIFEN
ncbi:hypothetical protein vseg_001699 [Gypsophila vaccaria]